MVGRGIHIERGREWGRQRAWPSSSTLRMRLFPPPKDIHSFTPLCKLVNHDIPLELCRTDLGHSRRWGKRRPKRSHRSSHWSSCKGNLFSTRQSEWIFFKRKKQKSQTVTEITIRASDKSPWLVKVHRISGKRTCLFFLSLSLNVSVHTHRTAEASVRFSSTLSVTASSWAWAWRRRWIWR